MKLENKVPSWEKKLSFILEVIIGLSGIYQLFFAQTAAGILILACLAIIILPGIFTKNLIRHIPIEIEILLFIMIILQYILGGVHDFYTVIPYYDKLVHFMLPFFVGVIGFLIAYTMFATGRLKASALSTVIIIALISLGIGALWEIFEYLSDTLIFPLVPYHHFQGNLQQVANVDTMTDLIDDLAGGLFGAILGLIFIRRNSKRNGRLTEFVEELSADIFKDGKKGT